MVSFFKFQKTLTILTTISLGIITTLPARASDLLLVGGGWEYPATDDAYGISMYDKIVERGGGAQNAKIKIFTTASNSGTSAQENGELWVQDFYDLYAKKYPGITPDVEWVDFHVDNCSSIQNQSSSGVINKINEATAIVFGGGDQSLITQCFFQEKPDTGTRTTTKVYETLTNKFTNDNVIIAGTSAGTTVQSKIPMITEGESYEALVNKPTALVGSPPLVRDLYYNPLGGLGLFPHGILDTHFSERGRQGRIIRLAALANVPLGIGIDENTGLLVTDVGKLTKSAEVLGQSGVNIFNLVNTTTEPKEEYFGINGVSLSYLTEGDSYNFQTQTATFSNKSDLVCDSNQNVPESTDIFSYRSTDGEGGSRANPREFTNVALELTKSCQKTIQGRSFESDPVAFNVTLTENEGFMGYTGLDSQGQLKTSFDNLSVDIQVVPESSHSISLLGLGIMGIIVKLRSRGKIKIFSK